MAVLHDEWEIKNFSCWSADVHGKYLKFSNGFRLYPKGFMGDDDYVKVCMSEIYEDVSELSFIGSEGSVICTKRPDWGLGAGGQVLCFFNSVFTGPKLEEVVSGIRRNEPQHEDRLIVRWETKQGRRPERFHTVIRAHSAFFQIKPEVFEVEDHRPKKPKLDDWKPISNIYFDHLGDRNQFIRVSVCKTGSTLVDTSVKFKLVSVLKNYVGEFGTGQKILALTSIWMLNGDNVMQKHEDNCILFEGDDRILDERNDHFLPLRVSMTEKEHILPFKVSLKELQGSTTIMRCKIVIGQLCQNFSYNADFQLSPDIRITGFSRFCEDISFGNASTALRKDLTCLYQDSDFSDFEARSGTVSIPTHRNILSARSPVLKAMLSGDMREAASRHMDIEDLDPHTLGCFLAFLYSGTSGEDLEWKVALGLYYAADKYQVPSLKQECITVLVASISLENVCDILSLADKHQDQMLRSVAHNFISKNFNDVVRSENWKELISSDSLLAATTVTDIAENKCDSD